MKCVAILGPGLLGGSIALAAKARGLADRVQVWARNEARVREIGECASVDLISADVAEATAGANLLVLATPVGAMKGLAERIVAARHLLPADALAVDVGSVKNLVHREVGPVFAGAGIPFVACHPMAGSEKTGWENADPELFQDAICVLTPGEEADAEAVNNAEDFWRALGCRTFLLGAQEHDEAVAKISHLPHAVAAALVLSALKADPTVARFSGNGFRDSSRVASGPPAMWTEILMENREALENLLENLQGRIGELLVFLRQMDHEKLRRFLEEAKGLRDASLRKR